MNTLAEAIEKIEGLAATPVVCRFCDGSGIGGYVTHDMAIDAESPDLEGQEVSCSCEDGIESWELSEMVSTEKVLAILKDVEVRPGLYEKGGLFGDLAESEKKRRGGGDAPFREWRFWMVFKRHPGLHRLPVVSGGISSRLMVYECEEDAQIAAGEPEDNFIAEEVRIVLVKGPAPEEK